ncbi:hypothetical protein GCM10023194_20920 [Planotetraspora phitsanulokensis]|uniref:Uncharacterized protein n=1 Tax=Planotetraspora phitsanulokensis TaxID=575192 RepID=A0A8J3XF60_9ACTN|nr:hypothetical protein [Planotetraspora phitsanulokensis]GII39277.1 hypothetical protein Pph01_42800 [Planotetraspora phitsanulokensis]
MVAEDRLAIVDGLLTLPFPGKDTHVGFRSTGPSYHVCVLQASQDFWNDRSEEIVETAQAEIDATLQSLVDALTVRWGGPEAIDLGPYPWSEGPTPEPMNQLCQLSGEMLIWRHLEVGRWVALAVGQSDPELPIELLVAVSETRIP